MQNQLLSVLVFDLYASHARQMYARERETVTTLGRGCMGIGPRVAAFLGKSALYMCLQSEQHAFSTAITSA